MNVKQEKFIVSSKIIRYKKAETRHDFIMVDSQKGQTKNLFSATEIGHITKAKKHCS
jgi:hypothetical protein